jgi:hypothetical protein
MFKNCFLKFSALLLLLFMSSSTGNAQDESCGFDNNTLSFAGTSIQQAKCLLRKVKMQGHLEEQTLPVLLEKIIDQKVQISKPELRAYLQAKQINENEIGGSLDSPISKGQDNNKDAPTARYFVIHDTSTPNLCQVNTFPNNINDSDWIYNNHQRDLYAKSKDAHLYIMRDGRSVAPQFVEIMENLRLN